MPRPTNCSPAGAAKATNCLRSVERSPRAPVSLNPETGQGTARGPRAVWAARPNPRQTLLLPFPRGRMFWGRGFPRAAENSPPAACAPHSITELLPLCQTTNTFSTIIPAQPHVYADQSRRQGNGGQGNDTQLFSHSSDLHSPDDDFAPASFVRLLVPASPGWEFKVRTCLVNSTLGNIGLPTRRAWAFAPERAGSELAAPPGRQFLSRVPRTNVGWTRFSAGRRKPHASGVLSPGRQLRA